VESLISYKKSPDLPMVKHHTTDRSSLGFHQPKVHGPRESKAISQRPIGLPNYSMLSVLSEILRAAERSVRRKTLAMIQEVPNFGCRVK
jgi:hypothetical protein